MNNYENFAPIAASFLNPDGSVTSFAGTQILPADNSRAEDYVNRAPIVNKVLNPDGSVGLLSDFFGGGGQILRGLTLVFEDGTSLQI